MRGFAIDRRPQTGYVAAVATVLGIGGVFVRSKDPDALRAWYRDLLGLDIQDWGGAQFGSAPGTYGVWSAFRADTTYFAPSEREFMIAAARAASGPADHGTQIVSPGRT